MMVRCDWQVLLAFALAGPQAWAARRAATRGREALGSAEYQALRAASHAPGRPSRSLAEGVPCCRRFALARLLLGAAGAEAQREDVLLKQMDENVDGIIDKMEFMYYARDALHEHDCEKKQRDIVYDYMETIYDFGDVNGDGVLSPDEFGFVQFLRGVDRMEMAAGAPPGGFGRAKAMEMHKALDASGDGRVCLAEFLHLFDGDLRMHTFGFSDAAADIFERAGGDRDGGVDPRGLQFAHYLSSEWALQLAAAYLFRFLDMNGDGSIGRSEVDERVRSLQARGNEQMALASRVQSNFVVFDADGDCRLTWEEAEALALHLLNDHTDFAWC